MNARHEREYRIQSTRRLRIVTWHSLLALPPPSSSIKYSLLALEQLSLHLLGIRYSVPFALVSPSFSRSFTQFFFGWQCSTLDHQHLLGSSFDILHKHIMTPHLSPLVAYTLASLRLDSEWAGCDGSYDP